MKKLALTALLCSAAVGLAVAGKPPPEVLEALGMTGADKPADTETATPSPSESAEPSGEVTEAQSLTASAEPPEQVTEARGLVKEFFTSLKGQLQAAMKAGGPVTAIEVCNVQAPAIAGSLADQSGWEVGRTSLKLRNPANSPDVWEQAVLEQFDARKANGEALEKMEFYEVVDAEGDKTFRYMKAIPTGEVCLKCHGAEIDPQVQTELRRLYPSDEATGYALGDIRGAFTLSKPL